MVNLDKKGRAWAEISVDNLLFNHNQVKQLANGKKVLAVLKADGYGHGAVPLARILEADGIDYFAVAASEEAVQLRNAGITTPILILGVVPGCDVEEMADLDVTLTVNSLETAQMYASLAKKPLRVHIKIDTGMSRIGFDAVKGVEQAGDGVLAVAQIPGLILEGIFTHLCSPDRAEDDDFTRKQIALFAQTADYVAQKGLVIPIRHCAASSGIMRFPEAHFDMVREGIMLYGIAPDDWMDDMMELRPVMQLRTRVTEVKTIEAGTPVGYNCTWSPTTSCRLATIAFGYSDGLYRANAGRFAPLVHGTRVQQVGKICMDMSMLDVTGCDVATGDIVTILGKDGDDTVMLNELLRHVPTCHDDFLSAVGKRVPRIYYKDGVAIDRLEYLR